MEKPEIVWYFAYGSNMSASKFTGSRKIVPIKSATATIPRWILTAEIPGVPYAEPSYYSVRPRDESKADEALIPDVVGVAYLITKEQYSKLVASEGGQIAYEDICISGKLLSGQWEDADVQLRTLASTSMVRHPEPTPSQRYMNLVKSGAQEADLPCSYQNFLALSPHYMPPKRLWTRIGASIFLAFCDPIWTMLDFITHANTRKDGKVPVYIVWLVRRVVFFIWMVHDFVFAPLFGRGDGIRGSDDPILIIESGRAPFMYWEKSF